MPDEDDQPLLLAPIVAIFGTLVVLLLAKVIPAFRGTAGGLPAVLTSLGALFGQ